MRQRLRNSSEASNVEGNQEVDDTSTNVQEDSWTMPRAQILGRTSYVILTLFALIAYCSWSVFHYQYQRLPVPLSAEEAGKRGFSEMEAMNHLNALTQLGPHPVGSDALVHAIKYVHGAAEMIKNASHWEVEVEVDQFHVKDGAHNILGGLFTGKTLVYADLNHIVMRITPKYASEVKENSILVSSHIDTVFSTGGAGDCSSCVAVMLELARAVSHWAHGFKSSVIFLFNTGEEEGLNGAHSFITQHPWRDTVRIAIDLEAMGIGGKSGIFEAGPHPGAIESFASVAKYPSANIMAQDLFASGIIKSSTDFLIYKEVGGLSGLDFAYTDNTAVYHTKNDKVELLEPGSLQHLGENMLAFLVHAASSPLEKHETVGAQVNPDHDSAIYFDILGSYMIVYRWGFANMLHNSVIMQSLLIWIMSLLMGGYTAAVSLVLSFLSIILMWILSISFSILVVFILPNLSWSAVPYITNPWLVVGLFGCPSLLGAFAGQHLGFLLLKEYLSHTYSKRYRTLSPSDQDDMAKLEAERWLFKSGTVQWLLILMAANYYKVGSTYIPLIWLVTPAFSYGLLEATLSPLRSPKPLKIATLLIALSVPLVVTSGAIMRIIGVFIGMAVRFDRNPGGSSEWFVSLIVSVIVAAVVCLMLVYVLSYIHLSGDKRSIILVICLLIGLSLAAVQSGIIPAYTDDLSRAVNVVHVVDSMGHQGKDGLTSYVSLFSSTPGNLKKEINHINEGFECGRDKMVDFVTFSMKYGCWTYDETESGWSQLDVPTLHVNSDRKAEERVTVVSIDTKVSRRWALAINTEKIADFKIQVSGDSDQLVSLGSKHSVDGKHVIQFSGGQNAPTKFDITLIWAKNSTQYSGQMGEDKEKYLLKLRTDVDRVTPKVDRVLTKLPSWCALFGKSTSPFTLAFLAGLPIDI